jgi:CO/xanthine dehydrogenase Mo-binding subunit
VRHDGVDKVTGRALYGADVRLPGMLYGRVLRSPHAHARIRAIDTARAAALPGVRAVVTAADLPDLADKIASLGEGAVNLRYQSCNMLARGKALYQGHAVAAVAAVSPQVAEEALALIQVDYEILTPVIDVLQAMRDDAPILHDELRTHEEGGVGERPTNIAEHFRYARGDLEQGFREAAAIIEREYVTATVHQGYIEPHAATALYNADGQVTIWCSTQGAFSVREQVAEILQLPISRLRVIPTEIGGGFGGKLNIYLEPIAVLLSRKSGHRPVQMTMSRAEVFMGTGPTSASVIRVKIGANDQGRITAAQAELCYAAGAFPGSPVGSGAACTFTPYRIPNLQIDGYDVVTNQPRAGAYRAPGATNAAFAAETAIDELCERLGIDPLEFRMVNGAQEGDRAPTGPAHPRIGYLETVAAARAHEHYRAPLGGPNRGRGVASGYWGNWGGTSSASASVNPDGTVSLVEGSTDIGGSRVAIAMQLAETLGIAAEDVRPQVVDTDSVGYNDVTGGSRTTFGTGWAAYEVGRRLIAEMRARAAQLWEVEPDLVRFDGGMFLCRERRASFKELAGQLGEAGGPVVASATVSPEGYGAGFATHIVDVEVDEETGKVAILRYTAVQDVGTAIHPSYVEGQLQGGAAQGLGWALNEEYVYDSEGRLLNAGFLDYRIPTCLDLPMIDTVIVEVPNPGHPYGVRGVGEAPIIPPPAAIANAIYRAVGVRMARLPMSPGRVLEALLGSQ